MTMQTVLEQKIHSTLSPIYCQVMNESHLHSVPKGSETHFRIEIVSDIFAHKRLLERHRLVNEALKEELAKIKACSLHTFTLDEWETRKDTMNSSPTCAGGKK